MNYTYLILGCILLLVSCQNTTSIDGIVQNAHTGKPISGARLGIRYEYSDGSDNTESGGQDFKTGSDGRFYFSDKCIFSTRIDDIRAPGYALQRGPRIVDNESNKLVIELIPLDGNLKIDVNNLTGQHDSIFFIVQNKCQYWYYWSVVNQTPKTYPIHLEIGEKYTESFYACKGEDTRVGWTFIRPTNGFVFQDSVHVEFTDTTSYTINY
jgi:hypothetical protein